MMSEAVSGRKVKDIFDEMAERWPSAVVARTEIGKFTGGMLSAKYMANLDSLGIGPGRVTIGRRVGYPTRQCSEWLRRRSSILAQTHRELGFVGKPRTL
jgi:hypothetical protein